MWLREWSCSHRLVLWRLIAVLLFVPAFSFIAAARDVAAAMPEIAAAQLPVEARETIQLIRRRGPFPYERDGVAFGNFQQLLPIKERGYYREYTVPTPGAKNRGARRIVAGRDGAFYYTDDHYKSFRRVRE
jgi:ribonuclease T1